MTEQRNACRRRRRRRSSIVIVFFFRFVNPGTILFFIFTILLHMMRPERESYCGFLPAPFHRAVIHDDNQ